MKNGSSVQIEFVYRPGIILHIPILVRIVGIRQKTIHYHHPVPLRVLQVLQAAHHP